MKLRLSLLAALVLTGCQQMNHAERVGSGAASASHLRSGSHKLPAQMTYVNPAFLAKPTTAGEQMSHADKENLWQRISDDMQLGMPSNALIAAQRKRVLRSNRHLATIASRAEPYLYLMVEEIERRGLPMELITVPMIESMFDPRARSQANAVGLWQFMPKTGKSFGLNQTGHYDGRQDVLASTQAALDYLEYLNRMFNGDWLHTLAAYNGGEGRILRAIKRNRRLGKSTDYWSLDLPGETRQYVPKILAMADVLSNAEKYGVRLPHLANQPKLKVITIYGQHDIRAAARSAGLNFQNIKRVNPGLKGNLSPRNRSYQLLVPPSKVAPLEEQLARMFAVVRSSMTAAKVPAVTARSAPSQFACANTLTAIAQKYGVSEEALMAANNLTPDSLCFGKRFVIPARTAQTARPVQQPHVAAVAPAATPVVSTASAVVTGAPAPRRDTPITPRIRAQASPVAPVAAVMAANVPLPASPTVHAAPVVKSPAVTASVRSPLLVTPPLPAYKAVAAAKKTPILKLDKLEHRVKAGDSLWRIGRSYGVTHQQLAQWNRISTRSILRPGMTLVVYPKTVKNTTLLNAMQVEFD
ncbi:MAG: transglycosylase SLT domain-containing protein [Aeromonas sp.]